LFQKIKFFKIVLNKKKKIDIYLEISIELVPIFNHLVYFLLTVNFLSLLIIKFQKFVIDSQFSFLYLFFLDFSFLLFGTL